MFILTARGIPFFYYGDEQGFSGGNDPANRESLWNKLDTTAEVYQKVSKINRARKAAKVWEHDYTERYICMNLYIIYNHRYRSTQEYIYTYRHLHFNIHWHMCAGLYAECTGIYRETYA